MRDTIVSLCDYSGILVKPWVDAGYNAILVDPQHPKGINRKGRITRIGYVVDHPETWKHLRQIAHRVAFVAGFPVCTDLAVSGSVRFADKKERDPEFQHRAMQLVHECRVIGEMIGAPYFFENPVSVISSAYRKPDHTFHPWEYGGYLPHDDEHPHYPEYFPPRDAYGKKNLSLGGERISDASEEACRNSSRATGRSGLQQGPQQVGWQVGQDEEHPKRHAPRVCAGVVRGAR